VLVLTWSWRQASGHVDHDLADSWNNVGLLQQEIGWYERAEESLRRSIALHRQVGGAETTEVAAPLHNLALSLRSQQKFEDARQAALDSLAIKRPNDWSLASLANTLAVLARIERQLGNLDTALSASEESLVLRRQVFGHSTAIASGLATHASILVDFDRIAEAESLFREALSLHQHAGSDQSLISADLRLGYGRFLHGQGRIEQAETVLAEALATAERHLPADAPQLERYRFPLAPPPDE
jgi:eukaryotic-like serine/threonine-protein kinase